MSDVSFRKLAAPIIRGEKIRAVIERAQRRAGMSYWRAYEAWYGRAKLTDDEIERISTALEAKQTQDARNELRDLRLRLEILESRLVQTDQDFHRETITALRQSVRGRG